MKDYIVSAIAAEGKVRAFAATTAEMVETARQKHNTTPVATAALGRLMTAGAMMGSMMKGEEDVLTLLIHGDGPIGGITVTADSQGRVKGYVKNPDVQLPINAKGKLDVAGAVGAGNLTVIRDIGLKEPYSGQVELISGEIAEDLTYYYSVSEQTPSSVGLGVLVSPDHKVDCAGGFILQLMPDAEEEVISRLEEKLKNITSVTSMLKAGKTPEDILMDLLEGLEPQILDKRETSFYCNCSREKIKKALGSVGLKQLGEMASEQDEIEVKCHFCNTAYHISSDELKEMIRERVKRIMPLE